MRQCAFVGCAEPRRVKGLCTGHYQQYRKRGLSGLTPIRGRGRSLAQRFEEKVDRSGYCHLWTGALSGTGYGSMRGPDGATVAAHRVAWELAHGPIPAGLQVDHICRVRRCVNPDHMRLVTTKQNMENQDAQRRNPTGYRGVSARPNGTFYARARHNGVQVNAGTWRTPEQAAKAAAALRAQLFTHSPEADGRVQV